MESTHWFLHLYKESTSLKPIEEVVQTWYRVPRLTLKFLILGTSLDHLATFTISMWSCEKATRPSSLKTQITYNTIASYKFTRIFYYILFDDEAPFTAYHCLVLSSLPFWLVCRLIHILRFLLPSFVVQWMVVIVVVTSCFTESLTMSSNNLICIICSRVTWRRISGI